MRKRERGRKRLKESEGTKEKRARGERDDINDINKSISICKNYKRIILNPGQNIHAKLTSLQLT